MSKLDKLQRPNQDKKKIQSQSHTSKLNPKEKINFYLTNIEQKIIHEIDEHKQQIPSQKSPFFEDNDSLKIKKKQKELQKLNEQKSKAQRKLKQLSDKQFSLKQEYRMNLKNQYLNKSGAVTGRRQTANKTIEVKTVQRDKNMQNQFLEDQNIPQNLLQKTKSLNKLRGRSQLTVEDIKTLKTLKEGYMKFEKQVQSKTITHNEELQKIRRQNQQLQQLLRKQRTDKKRKQIKEKLQDLEKQKQQRIRKFQEENVRLLQAKRKPKKFQKLMQDFEQKERSFEEQKVDQMKERLKKKLFDMVEINEHEKRYQELRSQQLKQIGEKYLQQSRFLKESKAEPHIVSRFYRSVLKEQKQRKVQNKRKQLATIEKCQRIKQYSAKVHQQHAPRVKTKENQQEEDNNSEKYNDKSLSFQKRKQLGNNYLKDLIKHLKHNQKPHSPNTLDQSSSRSSQFPKISSNSTKYKDYLTEQRNRYPSALERQKANQKKAKVRYHHSIEEVKKIMNQELNGRNKYQTIEKIQKIAQKLQHQLNDRNYLDKIKAKLQILESIT